MAREHFKNAAKTGAGRSIKIRPCRDIVSMTKWVKSNTSYAIWFAEPGWAKAELDVVFL
jgi:hypothetical protein